MIQTLDRPPFSLGTELSPGIYRDIDTGLLVRVYDEEASGAADQLMALSRLLGDLACEVDEPEFRGLVRVRPIR